LLRPETTQGRSEAAPLQRPESAQDGPSAASSPTGAAQPKGFAVTVDPPDVGARLWLGQLAAVEIKDGRALLNDLPDGEQELTVQAPGYQPFTTRVMVKDGRGSVEARLVPVRGAITVTARPGTEVTAVDERGREMPLGTIPPAGMLDVTNQLKVGRYTLKLEHADCAAVTVPGVQLVTGRTITVAPEQALLPGELRVSSVPTGAEVRVNGTVAGSTPATISNQPTGQVLKVEVFQHGHRRMEESVTLKPREVRTVNFGTLPVESGRIELRAADPSLRFDRAQIVVDGKSIEAAGIVGNGPFAFDGFEVGSHTVEITHADYEPWQRTVTVRDHDTVEVMVDLKPRLGTVACETTPAGARVIVNGGERHESALGGGTQAESLTPLRGALRPGPYALRFERDGYKSVVRNVTVVANRTAEVSVALEKISSAEEGQAWTVPDLNLKMMYVRPGTFTMGSANGDRDEKPQTRVTLTRSFWLGRTEVTQGQWEALMGSNPSHFKSAARDAPVEQVSWDDAMQFCRKLSERERSAGRLQDGYQYMLPTEAQWEFACRAGTTGDFAGGLDAMVWYNQNSGLATHPVAQKQANAWGLCDMHGNVWEWCLDWYGAYPGGSVTDPTGPSTGSSRIIRGGGWGETARNCRSAGRFKNVPVYRNTGLGFRVALVSQVNQ
jgi:formylglycine-generating enzyme required for sulfatase activity